jgi:hypothetical protein
MIAWFDHLAPWLQISLICALFLSVTWLSILGVHPLLRRLLHREEQIFRGSRANSSQNSSEAYGTFCWTIN